MRTCWIEVPRWRIGGQAHDVAYKCAHRIGVIGQRRGERHVRRASGIDSRRQVRADLAAETDFRRT